MQSILKYMPILAGALVVAAFDPISLGLLKRPGDWGADVAVAEGRFGLAAGCLEQAGELVRIKEPVSPYLEITEITFSMSSPACLPKLIPSARP